MADEFLYDWLLGAKRQPSIIQQEATMPSINCIDAIGYHSAYPQHIRNMEIDDSG